MLFRKKIEKACIYCQHCTKLNDDQALCIKRGIVDIHGKCHKFCYDPCKRMPSKAKAINFDKYNQEDYSL